MSIFAGALTDRFDKKKTMLVCDLLAAACNSESKGRSDCFGHCNFICRNRDDYRKLDCICFTKTKEQNTCHLRNHAFFNGDRELHARCFRQPFMWCLGQVIGWVLVPVMSANYDVVFRNTVPVELQGRVYACRNSLQFFTIPIGLFMGGFLVDEVCEPFMEIQKNNDFFTFLFGQGKGSGAAVAMFIFGVIGSLFCLVVGMKLNQYSYSDD